MWLDPRIIFLASAAFGLVLSIWLVGLLFWSSRQKVRERKLSERMGFMNQVAGEGRVIRLWHDGQEATTAVANHVRRISPIRRLEQMRLDAGWKSSAGTLLLMLAATAGLVSMATYIVTDNGMVAVCGAVAVIMGFWVALKFGISRRTALFERQLVDALELAARSLRVGQPLVGSFGLIAEEIEAPVGRLFGGIVQQQELGMGLDEAIRDAADVSGSQDMKFFATSVVIQLRSGGNLADMMERLAFVIRDRMRLSRRVRVLTAQTQFSKRVLQTMPFVVFVLLSVLNPDYMTPLYNTPGGRQLMVAAAVCLMLGSWAMNRIAVIKY